MKNSTILQTVVETPEFIKQAKQCMETQSREDFIRFIAENPTAGDIIVGSGGARKVRWASQAQQGKRGGVRVIYYYHNSKMPIFLFTVYSKNMKENILKSELKILNQIIRQLVKLYGEQKNE